MKTCGKCKVTKELTCFSKSKRRCKECCHKENKLWYEANKLIVSKRKADYYVDNLEQEKLRSKVFRETFPEKRKPKTPQAKIAANIRSKISHIISGRYKKSSTEKYLGCSFEELKAHLELQFTPELNWSNYGMHGWHIDHIIPLSAFDLSVESNLYRAWHYSNLRPLWYTDNLRKGKKIDVS
jgi:hypothetical protein